ncbi:hypothetical protein BaRGS_00036111 [Batillaria attramentaria]|uniref:Uncharacterized protein n=1 Tax=Batillaria attramentaria TaxID=370345 RepID=A0ABD0JCM1_9CAEN
MVGSATTRIARCNWDKSWRPSPASGAHRLARRRRKPWLMRPASSSSKKTPHEGKDIEGDPGRDLHKLADDCSYGELKPDLIRDRIVVGVADDNLSEELQAKANLTLDKAIQLARQWGARKQGQELLRGHESTVGSISRHLLVSVCHFL